MKAHQLFILSACCAVFMMACQKESLQSPSVTTSQLNNAGLQDAPVSDASGFSSKIDNPYFPVKPGTSFYYKHAEKDAGHIVIQNIQVDVTTDIKQIDGAPCRVVHDVVRERGEITEDTYDYYTQDTAGSVWYFGEDTKALVNGQWVTTGSWLAGVNGAAPGILMWAHPGDHIGETYRQEYLKDSAEDKGKVLSVSNTTTIQIGTFKNCVATEETTRLEPGVKEYKYYAPGIGNILTILNKGGAEHEELTKIVKN
jgi:hypothetical protein